ncbi:aminopeptidase N-like [Culex pipiens pallens]|uniref:aminopeptidase N-like n=1 Tax=Culex pipiens pallens TaxID=42434 RepID=UPI0019542412|nr:aminopeptidase N-like [Culex pipiens pallens]
MVIAIVLAAAAIIAAANGNEFRLPRNVLPTHYDVRLRTEVHQGAEDLRGTVGIAVNVVEPTGKIVLHSLGIEVRNVSLSDLDGNDRGVLRVNLDKSNQQLVLTKDDDLEVGSYLLRIDFAANNCVGCVVRQYEDEEGVQRNFLATQFEPTYARSAFPCFDEPGMKATFSLEMVHHKSRSVDSNMPLIDTAKPLEGDYVVSRFERTPKMSTYLLAFTVTEGYRSSGSGNHTTKARGSELSKTLYPLEVAAEILGALDQHTGLPYQDYLPKLTHLEVPIPSNWWRAKENWGLVVYCEDSLLHDPKTNDLDHQMITLQTISHEMAHMWFGNLVTHEWWDYVWLKEGFATLYMYYALHLARPSERWMEWFNLEAIPKGMRQRYHGPDAITRECKTPWDIRDNYRPAIFERAASVLNMFRQIVGDSSWQQVMRNFLKNHQLDAVVPNDLYQELEKVTEGSNLLPRNTSIEQIMNTWTANSGLPVLKVERNYNDSTITVTQHLLNRGKSQQWIIPYNYAQESEANFYEVGPIHWLAEPSTVIPTNATSNQWILFSKRHFGLYRINYDEKNWKLLAQALRSNISSIPRENRAQLFADALHFHEQNQLDKSVLFDLLTFLPNETESLVWYAALPVINPSKQDLRTFKYQDNFKTFLNHLTSRFYANIQQAPPTSLYDESVRKAVTFLACQAGNPDCLATSYNTFRERFLANSTDLPPDDTVTVFCFGAQQASDAEFQWLLEQQQQGSAGDERRQSQLMRSLLCTKQPARLRTVIERINEEREYYAELGEGLKTELGEEQFWVLVELLQDATFIDQLSVEVLWRIMGAMNSRKQSQEAEKAMKELREKFRSRRWEGRSGYWYVTPGRSQTIPTISTRNLTSV